MFCWLSRYKWAWNNLILQKQIVIYFVDMEEKEKVKNLEEWLYCQLFLSFVLILQQTIYYLLNLYILHLFMSIIFNSWLVKLYIINYFNLFPIHTLLSFKTSFEFFFLPIDLYLKMYNYDHCHITVSWTHIHFYIGALTLLHVFSCHFSHIHW